MGATREDPRQQQRGHEEGGGAQRKVKVGMGTPKSVAELFTSDIASKYQKQGSTDLAFLDEDIEHFDFDGNSTGYANVGSIAFDTMEFGSEYVSAVPRKTLTRTSNTETFVGFSDLEIDLGKAAFIVDDIVHSSDPSFSQGGLKSDKLKLDQVLSLNIFL